MKKIIYFCDYCGRQIKGPAYTLRITTTEDSKPVTMFDPPDACLECVRGLMEAIKPGAEPAKKPEKRASKKPLDMGKVHALRNAGWSLAKIADEMKVSPQTIANRLAEGEAVNEQPEPEE